MFLMLVLTLPAALVINAFDESQYLSRAEGSIWSGQARWQQPGQQPLLVQWRWAGGRSWQWQASDQSTELRGQWRPGRSLMLPVVEGRLAVERVDLAQWLQVSRPLGHLELMLEHVELLDHAPPQATGEILWRDAGLTGAIQEPLGLIRLRLNPHEGVLRVAVESLEPAPVMVRGRIDLDADSYRVDLWLRGERGRPELQQALIYLGDLQPDGQVRLQLRGATGLRRPTSLTSPGLPERRSESG